MAVTSGLDASGRWLGVRMEAIGRRDLNGMWQPILPMEPPLAATTPALVLSTRTVVPMDRQGGGVSPLHGSRSIMFGSDSTATNPWHGDLSSTAALRQERTLP
jgi:hypothetical protein